MGQRLFCFIAQYCLIFNAIHVKVLKLNNHDNLPVVQNLFRILFTDSSKTQGGVRQSVIWRTLLRYSLSTIENTMSNVVKQRTVFVIEYK